MKVKLLAFIVLFTFTSSAYAEYYLVYPVVFSSSCCERSKSYKKHYASKDKKSHKHAISKKRSSYNIEVYYPCSYSASACNACGNCSACSSCGCSYAYPGYAVFTGRPNDCVTYQEMDYGYDGY